MALTGILPFHAELTFDIMRKPKEGAPPGPRSIFAMKEFD
jgi:hypothetical protein